VSPDHRGAPAGHTGMVLVLDGPSRIGKSTTLAALQDRWPEVRPGPLIDVGLDRILAGLGSAGLHRWWELIRHRETPGSEPAERVAWGPLGRELVAGMHRAAASWAQAGFDVAVEHVLLDRITAADLRSSLEGLPVLHVGLTCDPVVLEDRAQDTVPYMLGSPVAQLAVTAGVTTRDLTLDTTERTTEELVDAILAAVVEGQQEGTAPAPY
jgi:chloramphenicol 3-O-phosphotransferase